MRSGRDTGYLNRNRSVHRPAEFLGSKAGGLEYGVPVDLIQFSLEAPEEGAGPDRLRVLCTVIDGIPAFGRPLQPL